MAHFVRLLLVVIDVVLLTFLYSKISGRKLSTRIFVFSTLLYFILAILSISFANSLLLYFMQAIFFLALSYFLRETRQKTLIVFYALFPLVLWNLFHRFLAYFLMPLLGLNANTFNQNTVILLLNSLLAIAFILAIFRLLKYDFVHLREEYLLEKNRRVLIFLNLSMLFYYGITQILSYIEVSYKIPTLSYRQFLVIVYIILFLSALNLLVRHLREHLQERLIEQQEMQLDNLTRYSQRIEELYREVRSFRHDYSNILRSLRLGIENKDLEAIETIYNGVLKNSEKQLTHSKFDIGRLVNIQNDALKSLLAAKFLEAQNKGIAAFIEVPDLIRPKGMELVDLITVLSILCDNALEANPEKLSLVYFEHDNKQIFIIENSTEEESIDVSSIFDYGYSTKGSNRGIGLANLQTIMNRYPKATITTTSQNYLFRQTVEIKGLEDG
ncbi:sensor histidine kinase [Streptococcus oricebi]|uniref:Sensor histidine kinase NatK-like C-terminal domain-containing protein n=1 Tax=Streptococcus oricebi TaxID=1547447 RepID=A0ABS5B2X6_9STRE|nr:GHKL domain-containing protein [Streptococcus oricebi]MBP2623191.1 hypothetical protein [Streptococcus oricebi]